MKVSNSWRKKQLVQQYFKSQILAYRAEGKSYREIADLINRKHIPYSKFSSEVISKDIVARVIKKSQEKKDNKLVEDNNNFLIKKALNKYKNILISRFKELKSFMQEEVILKNLHKNFNVNILSKEPKYNEIFVSYSDFKKFILKNANE